MSLEQQPVEASFGSLRDMSPNDIAITHSEMYSRQDRATDSGIADRFNEEYSAFVNALEKLAETDIGHAIAIYTELTHSAEQSNRILAAQTVYSIARHAPEAALPLWKILMDEEGAVGYDAWKSLLVAAAKEPVLSLKQVAPLITAHTGEHEYDEEREYGERSARRV